MQRSATLSAPPLTRSLTPCPRTELTDADGKSLGTALDLVEAVERIAGQYYGRQGDEQFRVYCRLKPGTREILEKSREFKFGEENTVYHVGYAVFLSPGRQGAEHPVLHLRRRSPGRHRRGLPIQQAPGSHVEWPPHLVPILTFEPATTINATTIAGQAWLTGGLRY